MLLRSESFRNVDSEIFHDALKILCKQLFFDHHQQRQGHLSRDLNYYYKIFSKEQTNLEYCLHPLKHEHVQDSEHQEKGKLGREKGKEPLAGVHVGFKAHRLEMVPQVGKPLLYKPVQLIEPQLQLFKIFPIK